MNKQHNSLEQLINLILNEYKYEDLVQFLTNFNICLMRKKNRKLERDYAETILNIRNVSFDKLNSTDKNIIESALTFLFPKS